MNEIVTSVAKRLVCTIVATMVIYLACSIGVIAAPTAEAQMVATEQAVATQIYSGAGDILDIPAQMSALQTYYPEGSPWSNTAVYCNYDAWWVYAGGCHAFAMLASDATFGTSASVTTLMNQTPADILPGDVVRIGDTHSVFVISVDTESITICEGNYNQSIHWGRVLTKQSLEGQISFICRRGV